MDIFIRRIKFYSYILETIEHNGTNHGCQILIHDWVSKCDMDDIFNRLSKHNIRGTIATAGETRILKLTWE